MSTQEQETNQTTQAKTAFTASLHAVGTNHDAPLRARALNIHSNADVLSRQEAAVARATDELGERNGEMEGVVDGARDGLKEIGDVQNWAEVIERELMVLEETARMVEDGQRTGEEGEQGQRIGEGEEEQRASGQDGRKGWLKWW